MTSRPPRLNGEALAIDWKATQAAVQARGYSPGPQDGLVGPSTITALLAYAVGRQPDLNIRLVGRELARLAARYGLYESPARLAEFVAQTAIESGRYTTFEENMRYSAKRLMQVWPSRFKTLAQALPYAWDPSDPDREDIALANLVYGSRMGNERNGTADNDGWDHRGSGILQHTGAGEYALLKQRLGYEPDDVRDPAKSVLAALDYWSRASVNRFIDRADYSGARRAVNGGTHGLADVAAIRSRVLKVLK